jgi:hypothetical protein
MTRTGHSGQRFTCAVVVPELGPRAFPHLSEPLARLRLGRCAECALRLHCGCSETCNCPKTECVDSRK